MNKDNLPAGYVFKINLSKHEMDQFLAGWEELQSEAEDNLMESMQYADANQVIANIKAKL